MSRRRYDALHHNHERLRERHAKLQEKADDAQRWAKIAAQVRDELRAERSAHAQTRLLIGQLTDTIAGYPAAVAELLNPRQADQTAAHQAGQQMADLDPTPARIYIPDIEGDEWMPDNLRDEAQANGSG